MVKLVDAAQQQRLDQPRQRRHAKRRQRQSEPEARAVAGGLVGEIGAQHIKGAMREIDEAQQPEDDAEADREQEIDHAEPEAVEDLEQIDQEPRSARQPILQPAASGDRNDLPRLTMSAKSLASRIALLALPFSR